MLNYFLQKPGSHLNIPQFLIFIGLCIAAWLIIVAGHITFPSQNLIPHLIRSAISAIADLLLIFGSIWLLKKTNIPSAAMGLQLSIKSLLNFLFGVFIGIASLTFLASTLYLFIPFHFETGSFKGSEVIKESHSYFWGNFLEELIFRGYPLIVLSQLWGWRKAVLIMALPFGLFHLPGLGFTMEGLKMIMTTATYSFVFSYAFILTGSLWTAIGVHVTSNILLHAVLGLDGAGKALYKPVFHSKWPVNYDPGFISFLLTAIILATTLFLLITRLKKK